MIHITTPKHFGKTVYRVMVVVSCLVLSVQALAVAGQGGYFVGVPVMLSQQPAIRPIHTNSTHDQWLCSAESRGTVDAGSNKPTSRSQYFSRISSNSVKSLENTMGIKTKCKSMPESLQTRFEVNGRQLDGAIKLLDMNKKNVSLSQNSLRLTNLGTEVNGIGFALSIVATIFICSTPPLTLGCILSGVTGILSGVVLFRSALSAINAPKNLDLINKQVELQRRVVEEMRIRHNEAYQAIQEWNKQNPCKL
jgi:hypothetical protein